jgi:WD40 repeat protein
MHRTDPRSSRLEVPVTTDPPAAWPVLMAQAGKRGNREVMLPPGLDGPMLRSVLEGLITTEDDPAAVKSVSVAPDLTLVSRQVRATSDGTAKVWDSRTGRPGAELTGHSGLISAVALSRDGLVAATAGWDSTLRTWDTRTGEAIAVITESRRFSGCCLDPEGRRLAATGFDGTVSVYEALTGEPVAQAQLPVPLPGPVTVDSSTVFAGAQDGTIRRVRGGKDELDPLEGHEGPVTAVALSPDGRLLAGAGRDGTIIVWAREPAQQPLRLTGHAGGATACVFLDAERLLTAGWDGLVRLWNLPTRTTTTVWQDASAIRALAVLGRNVAISSQNGVITSVDPTGAADPVILSTGTGHVDTMAGAVDGPVLLTGSTNDVPDGTPVRDGFGRPATFTEALLIPGHVFSGKVTPSVWHRIHAESLAAMGIASADPSGRTVVSAPRLALG